MPLPDRGEEEDLKEVVVEEKEEEEVEEGAFLEGELVDRLPFLQERSHQGIAVNHQEPDAEEALRTCEFTALAYPSRLTKHGAILYHNHVLQSNSSCTVYYSTSMLLFCQEPVNSFFSFFFFDSGSAMGGVYLIGGKPRHLFLERIRVRRGSGTAF